MCIEVRIRTSLDRTETAAQAADLVGTAKQFHSEIVLIDHEHTIHVKTMISPLELFGRVGTHVQLLINGPDEEAAMQSMLRILQPTQ
ncbi:HPr family phosphocarrier protein [Burkholderia gladioli]|uniref:HPr family phosphocarrier protein n=1 Tax=Burkholderia gladioli TaxID=28095 RepID=UPI003D25089A